MFSWKYVSLVIGYSSLILPRLERIIAKSMPELLTFVQSIVSPCAHETSIPVSASVVYSDIVSTDIAELS